MSTIDHPAHYGGDTPYEAIKVIEAWGLGFNLGNAVKYIARAGKKGDETEDIDKALWYLQRHRDSLGGFTPELAPVVHVACKICGGARDDGDLGSSRCAACRAA